MDEHKKNSVINPYTFLKSVFLYFDRECIDDRNFVFSIPISLLRILFGYDLLNQLKALETVSFCYFL